MHSHGSDAKWHRQKRKTSPLVISELAGTDCDQWHPCHMTRVPSYGKRRKESHSHGERRERIQRRKWDKNTEIKKKLPWTVVSKWKLSDMWTNPPTHPDFRILGNNLCLSFLESWIHLKKTGLQLLLHKDKSRRHRDGWEEYFVEQCIYSCFTDEAIMTANCLWRKSCLRRYFKIKVCLTHKPML